MLNLMWYQIRISAYQPNRLRLILYIAPGWARQVQLLLRNHNLDLLIRANHLLTTKDPGMFCKFLRQLDPSIAMNTALTRYEIACAQDVRGQFRPAAVFEEQCAAVRGVLALLPEPVRKR